MILGLPLMMKFLIELSMAFKPGFKLKLGMVFMRDGLRMVYPISLLEFSSHY